MCTATAPIAHSIHCNAALENASANRAIGAAKIVALASG